MVPCTSQTLPCGGTAQLQLRFVCGKFAHWQRFDRLQVQGPGKDQKRERMMARKRPSDLSDSEMEAAVELELAAFSTEFNEPPFEAYFRTTWQGKLGESLRQYLLSTVLILCSAVQCSAV